MEICCRDGREDAVKLSYLKLYRGDVLVGASLFLPVCRRSLLFFFCFEEKKQTCVIITNDLKNVEKIWI